MKKRFLGRTGIQVSELGFGGWAIGGHGWGPQDDNDSVEALHTALDMGVTYIDTALAYGGGRSEKIIGRVLGERGERVIVSTKVVPKCWKWGPPPEADINDYFPPDWIVQSCEESLRNLGVDCIDILFLHTWNVAWGHHSEWYEAMLRLKEQGKIRAIGISVADRRAAEANVHLEAGRPDAIQVVYNIFEQEPEYSLFPLALKHNVGIIARVPLGSGALTGKWTLDTRFPEGDWRGEWTPDGWLAENVAMAEKARPIAEATGLPMTIVALRFCLRHSAVTSVIPGARNAQQARMNFAAGNGPPLDDNAVTAFKELWRAREIHGTFNGSL